MPRVMKALRKDNKGATAIEFAFVAPVLFLLILGIIEFGLLFATQASLEGAASDAARKYKALAQESEPVADITEIRNFIVEYSNGFIDPENLQVTAKKLESFNGGVQPSDPDAPDDAGIVSEIIQYSISYDYELYTPFLSNLLTGDRGVLQVKAAIAVQNEPAIDG